jgi:hypothetical protein
LLLLELRNIFLAGLISLSRLEERRREDLRRLIFIFFWRLCSLVFWVVEDRSGGHLLVLFRHHLVHCVVEGVDVSIVFVRRDGGVLQALEVIQVEPVLLEKGLHISVLEPFPFGLLVQHPQVELVSFWDVFEVVLLYSYFIVV